jgi:hypothetical protein
MSLGERGPVDEQNAVAPAGQQHRGGRAAAAGAHDDRVECARAGHADEGPPLSIRCRRAVAVGARLELLGGQTERR